MPDVAVGDRCLLGRGELYFDRFDSNNLPTGELFLGNVTSFTILPTDTLAEKYSSAEPSSPLLVRVNVRRLVEMTATLDEYSKENLALAFMGDNVDLLQTTQTRTQQNQGAMKKDRWFQVKDTAASNIPVRGITAVTVRRVTPTISAAVVNVDYKIDVPRARIYFMPTSAVFADGNQWDITYTSSTIVAGSIPTVRGGVNSFVKGFVRFVGRPASGPTWEIEAWTVSINPDSAVPFITDQDFGNFNLKGAVLADLVNHPSEPFFRAISLSNV